ncbi:RadC-like JAB domain-containing protein [Chitinophaga eiseniae]|uniref:RadC-like JAB domain-containing protein n=1 Tax=Chitinophaga eiseniae TaxID=634771 RepID=A0A1T4KNH7_9BACT|nr:JAB domain-containing protein [Chitinophaga eiseniae]SJZ43907.1 RadC-like JAB domain-containing protein [Chitinophaga eiseniae]
MKTSGHLSLFSVTEVELIYRNKIRPEDRIIIRQAANAYDVLMDTWDRNKIELVEQFKILLLDQGNACLGIAEIATGGVSSCIVDPKVIFAIALKARATNIILAHNHPSERLCASPADIALTQKLCEAGKFMDIRVTDHLIVTPQRYYSFADEGLMPFL